VYEILGKDYIHVHHIVPLSEIKQEYTLNLVQDLAPVFPNYHSMIHRVTPVLKIEKLKELL
jgi:5-methylcytosine-specific restriction protein A